MYKKNPTPSLRLYWVSSDILKQIIYNDLEFSYKKIEQKLLEFLCYQSPYLIQGTSKYPAICNILFRHKDGNKLLYQKFEKYVKTFFDERLIAADKNVSSACLAISFNFVDRGTKDSLMQRFFNEFLLYKQWGMLLFLRNEENIKIFQNIMTQKIENLDLKSAEEFFNYLYLTSAIDNSLHQNFINKFKNLQPKFDAQESFAEDFEYISGKKDLYQECLKNFNLENSLPKNNSAPKEKLRIAVCISGQLRGYKKSLESWKGFAAEDCDVTYFVHTWKHVGRKYPNPPSDARSLSGKFLQEWRNAWFNLEERVMNERYKNIFKIFSESDTVTEEQLQKLYNAKKVVVEDDRDKKFEHFSNSEKMYYKVYECHKLARNSGQDFDLIIRIRPDRELIIERPIDWKKIHNHLLEKNKLIVDSGPYLHPHSEYVIGDQLAISASNVMDRYAMTYKITEYAKKISLNGLPKEHMAHINFSYTTLYQNIEITNLSHFHPHFMYCGALLDPELLSAQKVFDAIKLDVKDSKDPIDIALLAAAAADLRSKNSQIS